MQKNVINTDLSGKVAVVTGAGGAICSVLSIALARAGAKVALLNRTFDKAERVAVLIRREGGTAKAYACNVLSREMCEKTAAEILDDYGPCDILINGAGGNAPGASTDNDRYEDGDIDGDVQSFFDLSEDSVRDVFDLNFAGTLIPAQVFSRQMIGREGCNILNISSMNAYTPLTRIPAYSGAKAAVSNFTQWLAVYFSKAGIRVNAIAPGFFASSQNAKLLFDENGQPTARTHKILDATPMGRLGDTEKELTGAVLFLLNNEAASFITGVCIPVDGGFSSYSGV